MDLEYDYDKEKVIAGWSVSLYNQICQRLGLPEVTSSCERKAGL